MTIILENGSGELWGRLEHEDFLLTTVGNNQKEVTDNLRESLADFLTHEGKDIPAWAGVKAEDVVFDYTYDLTAFFDTFSSIKINSIAENAGINKSLLRQYVSGAKKPSEQQAKKIEAAIHQLGQSLMTVRVC